MNLTSMSPEALFERLERVLDHWSEDRRHLHGFGLLSSDVGDAARRGRLKQSRTVLVGNCLLYTYDAADE